MDKDFLKGVKFALGTLFVFSLLGLVYAVGFHIAEEVLGGTFSGNFEFNGSVNFTNANVSGISSGLVKLESFNVSSVSNLDFNLSAHSGQYSSFIIDIQYLEVGTGGALIRLRTSEDGSTFDSGALDYDYTGWRATQNNNLGVYGSTASPYIQISDGIAAGANNALSGSVKIYRAEQNEYTALHSDVLYYESGLNVRTQQVNGRRLEANDVKLVRILPSTGTMNIRATFYGLE